MKVWNYLQKTLELPLSIDIIMQMHKIMMDGEKYVLVGEYGKSPAFAGYHTFVRVGYIERYMEDATFRSHETKKHNLIIPATNLFVNMHPFEDGNRRICRLILTHVLIADKMLSISSHFKLLS